MPTTSNFGWTTPADTDLVKDGAAAIRTLGNGIDTSFIDLKGGTTDQVLAKNSNSDLDFKWVAQDDSNAIQNSIVDAKGDLISATGNDVPARLAVGSNGQVLMADSATSTGLKWATPGAGGFTKISTTSISAVASQDIDSVFSSTYNNYLVVVNYMHSVSGSTAEDLYLRFRYSSTTKTSGYYAGGFFVRPDSITGDFGSVENGGQFILATNLGAEASPTTGFFYVTTQGGTSSRLFVNGQYFQEFGTGGGSASFFGGSTKEAQTWTGMRFLSSGGGNIYGEVTVYGMDK
jgi:hypothetical protein